jgi:hypothetical protein
LLLFRMLLFSSMMGVREMSLVGERGSTKALDVAGGDFDSSVNRSKSLNGDLSREGNCPIVDTWTEKVRFNGD